MFIAFGVIADFMLPQVLRSMFAAASTLSGKHILLHFLRKYSLNMLFFSICFILIEHVICNVHALMPFLYSDIFMKKETSTLKQLESNDVCARSEKLSNNEVKNNFKMNC